MQAAVAAAFPWASFFFAFSSSVSGQPPVSRQRGHRGASEAGQSPHLPEENVRVSEGLLFFLFGIFS
jgi:hypothetical protein